MINATIDNIKYSGIDTINIGGKTINLESDASAPAGAALEEFEVTVDPSGGDYGAISFPVATSGRTVNIIKNVTAAGPRPPKLMSVIYDADKNAINCSVITFAGAAQSIATAKISVSDCTMKVLGTTLVMFNDAGQQYTCYRYTD